jgi:gliding motility-associated-like protein
MVRFFIGTVCAVALTFLTAGNADAQSCDCPTECNICFGGIKEFVLQYKGDGPATITVKDAANTIFNEQLNPGDLFVVRGILADGRFSGIKIYMYIDGKEDTAIDVLCTSNTVVNKEYGHFVIVAARRLDGKAICCKAGDNSDEIAPVFISVPEDIIVFTDPGKCTAAVTWDAPVVDDCNLDKVRSTDKPGDFPVGLTTVIYTAEDEENNTSIYTFTVTVTDNIPPVIACPENISITTKIKEGEAVSWTEPEATDNCAVEPPFSSRVSGSVFSPGETIVTYTVADHVGNISTCSFTVTVTLEKEPEVDPPPPPVEEELPLDIGRVVTPDGDGKNDFWRIGNIEQFPDNNILVIDRWGSTIFKASHYNNESVVWRGESSSSGKLPAGTYFFVINYKRSGGSVEKRGFIELIP